MATKIAMIEAQTGHEIEHNLFTDPDEAEQQPRQNLSDDTLAAFGLVILSKEQAEVLEMQRLAEEQAAKE